jgi:hypothetical protein
LKSALRPKVWLKSRRRYIVINQTAKHWWQIDRQSRKDSVGKSIDLEDYIVKTIPRPSRRSCARCAFARSGRQYRDRYFIDMDERKNRLKVMAVLEEAMRGIARPTSILQFNDFGLWRLTRKRVKLIAGAHAMRSVPAIAKAPDTSRALKPWCERGFCSSAAQNGARRAFEEQGHGAAAGIRITQSSLKVESDEIFLRRVGRSAAAGGVLVRSDPPAASLRSSRFGLRLNWKPGIHISRVKTGL